MSNFVTWVKRHRRKFVISGAVLGGLYLVGKVAERQMAKLQEEETRKILEAARKQNHFTSTENTCQRTIAALFPALRQMIADKLDTDSITNILRQKPQTEDKVQFWTELKVISVSRCVVLVLSGVYLCVMLRVQLNILAGYLYDQQISCTAGTPHLNNNTKLHKLSTELQENFLSICNNFVSEGVERLCDQVSSVVSSSLKNLNLQQRLSLTELEALFLDIFKQIQSGESDTCILANPGLYFLPSTDQFITGLTEADQEDVKRMFAETLDVLESEDTRGLVNQLCRQGLSHIMDNVGEYYNTAGLSHCSSQTKSSLQDSGFVSPATISLPVAKIIPLLSSQVVVTVGEQDVWLLHLQESPSVKVLGANVYESFCQSSPTQPQQEQTWGQWITSTAAAWL